MKYTVRQLAQIANISVRTLHYYDQVSLLKPAYVENNGYRYYEQKQLIRLQQIMFFKELEFSLEEIRMILDSPTFDYVQALNEQKEMLQLKNERLNELLSTINNTIKTMENNKDIKGEHLFGGFSEDQLDAYKNEAKQRWGHTDAWKQSQKITANWTKDDFARIEAEANEILNRIVELMDRGVEDVDVQKEIALYHKHMGQFYDCGLEIFGSLGKMYSEDPRFTAYYEKIAPGLAKFMTGAIGYYCEKNK